MFLQDKTTLVLPASVRIHEAIEVVVMPLPLSFNLLGYAQYIVERLSFYLIFIDLLTWTPAIVPLRDEKPEPRTPRTRSMEECRSVWVPCRSDQLIATA